MKRTVVLIGFLDQGNLGIGYLAANLEVAGFAPRILDFRRSPAVLLEQVRRHEPVIVGFSLIFQYALPEFARLAAYLRANGVACHFTAGGHYPSICYESVLSAIPELDSVVRFEGEETLAALARRLVLGDDWRVTRSVAFRDAEGVRATPLRPLIPNLDSLPFTKRPGEFEQVLGIRAAPILASRGCARDCAFCSIRRFYGEPPGQLVRRRSPENVVCEMMRLYAEDGVEIFLFQDDDFPLAGEAGRRWLKSFLFALEASGLHGHVLWKISCRADEIDESLFAEMRDAGLYLVYLGLESGSPAGLAALNKKVTVAVNQRAVAILKRLGILFEFGFMMFDPASTFTSIRENVAFLRGIVGDGTTAATFCRMLPYGGTPIEARLRGEGRLKGDIANPDYDFPDSRLDACHHRLNAALAGWVLGAEALSPTINWAWHEIAVIERLFPPLPGLGDYADFLRNLTRSANARLFAAVEAGVAASEVEDGEADGWNHEVEMELTAEAASISETLLARRNAFVADNQDRLLSALGGRLNPVPRRADNG